MSDDAIDRLARIPDAIARLASGLSPDDLRWRPETGDFSFVEQACHLRDLEAEGYAVRIRRLLEEEAPRLEGFDGARVAAERDYAAEDFEAAVAAFGAARAANVAALGRLDAATLERAGELDGRALTLAGLLAMMAEHDADHLGQMRAIRAALYPNDPMVYI